MKLKVRLFLGIILSILAGFYLLFDFIVNDIRYRYLETVEESLNDTANILATFLESEIKNGRVRTTGIRHLFDRISTRSFAAKIYAISKTTVNLEIYVTDKSGIVIFDSQNGRDVGKDFSSWNDVHLTLRGKYGARSSALSSTTSALFVAAPIKTGSTIHGVVTVVKPKDTILLFIEHATRKFIMAGAFTCAILILLNIGITTWVTRPILKLTEYVKSLKSKRTATLPRFGRTEIRELALAFEEMREELEGKKYIEQYVQTLTHEIKSPLSSIRGAAELLEGGLPQKEQPRFIENIRTEGQRIEQIIERLLELASLENRKGLRDIEPINLAELVREAEESAGPELKQKNITLASEIPGTSIVSGERFLLRQAVANLVQNAIDFTPSGGTITVRSTISQTDGALSHALEVIDSGAGIPAYALQRVFDRFYSLPREDTRKKSSGLGLSFVREVAQLHGGSIQITNNIDRGVTACLILPCQTAVD